VIGRPNVRSIVHRRSVSVLRRTVTTPRFTYDPGRMRGMARTMDRENRQTTVERRTDENA
jgi:hypothetical protein